MEKEYRWLPRLAPALSLPVPVPLAIGAAGHGFPWPWTVCRWLKGTNPSAGALPRPQELSAALAGFLHSLHAIDTTGGPQAERGLPVTTRNKPFRTAMAALSEISATTRTNPGSPLADAAIAAIDLEAIEDCWATDSAAAPWDGPPVWVHADISPLNILCDGDGALTAVLDFGCTGIGDPACDLGAVWNTLPPSARQRFRNGLDVDDATWARGRAWALSIAVIQLPYYYRTNSGLAEISHRVIDAVLGTRESDQARSGDPLTP